MTVVADSAPVTSVTKLEDLSDADFRDLVDRELRKDHPSTQTQERAELTAISERFRHPAVIDRWIMYLEIMKASSETQLSAKRSDLKKTHGTVSEAEYLTKRRAYEAWKAGNVRFLHSVQIRLIEARAIRARRDRAAMRKAIETHRAAATVENYEPEAHDLTLWAVLD